MKTSELVGKTLDYAVGKIDQRDWTEEDLIANLQEDDDGYFYGPSTNWQQGGPIIEREAICVDRMISGNLIYIQANPNQTDEIGPKLATELESLLPVWRSFSEEI